MIIEKFFPTFVYGKDVQLDNNKLAQDIINWSNQDKGVQKTNYKGWHSTTDMANKPEYSPLITELFRMQKEIYDNEHLDRNAFLGNMWANINPPGSMNQPHVHPNALFSGVYYVKSGNHDSGDTVFENPVKSTYIDRGNLFLDHMHTLRIKPQDGLLVIFPSYLSHYQAIYKGTEDRIVVAFNASIDKREEV